MTPEMVGAERKLVMGKHTGTHSVESGSSVRLRPYRRAGQAGHPPRQGLPEPKRRVTVDILERFAEEAGVERQQEQRRCAPEECLTVCHRPRAPAVALERTDGCDS